MVPAQKALIHGHNFKNQYSEETCKGLLIHLPSTMLQRRLRISRPRQPISYLSRACLWLAD
jgi:hypothetical protein